MKIKRIYGPNPYYRMGRKGTTYAVFKRRPIESGKPFIWSPDVGPNRVRLFYRCHSCKEISEIKHHVSDKGFIYHCVKCPSCGFGIFAYLEGWKGKDDILQKANQARAKLARRSS
jgi:hypothetical protein